MAQLKEYDVTYRNRSGDMKTQKARCSGYTDLEVRKSFEQQNYQVISVVYRKMVL